MMSALRRQFDSGDPAVNGWLSADSPYLAEVLSWAGYDSVTVDVQHGMFDLGGAIHLIQAVSAGPAVPLARVPRLDAALIGKLLDAGAEGIICPAIDDAAQTAAFVAMCAYPPVGVRSFGPARANVAGHTGYVEQADVMTWAMIESRPGLHHLREIVATPGLDGVYVGPNDLALALGEVAGATRPGPLVDAALDQIVAAANDAGILAGIFCPNGEVAREMAGRGFRLVTPGNDMALLRAAVQREISATRGLPSVVRQSSGY
jgi:4-hydroxy-2-oxoheptanedioate aldolase